jgi:hypothetical protein
VRMIEPASRRPTTSLVVRPLLAALAAVASLAMTLPAPASAGAFSGLEGTWGGAGTATFDGGTREKLRCNGYYKGGGGSDLSMVIRCASPGGAKIELRGNLHDSGGKVSGTWEERTYNAAGTITGSTGPGSLKVGISGAITGNMSVSFGTSSQSVSIATTGTTLRTVNISFSRR